MNNMADNTEDYLKRVVKDFVSRQSLSDDTKVGRSTMKKRRQQVLHLITKRGRGRACAQHWCNRNGVDEFVDLIRGYLLYEDDDAAFSDEWGREHSIDDVIHILCQLSQLQYETSTKEHQNKTINVSPRPKVKAVMVKFGKTEVGLLLKDSGNTKCQMAIDKLAKMDDVVLFKELGRFLNFGQFEKSTGTLQKQFARVFWSNGIQTNIAFQSTRTTVGSGPNQRRPLPPPGMEVTSRIIEGYGSTHHFMAPGDDEILFQTLNGNQITREELHKKYRIISVDPGVKQQDAVEIRRKDGEVNDDGEKKHEVVERFTLNTNHIFEAGCGSRLTKFSGRGTKPLINHFSSLSLLSMTHPHNDVVNDVYMKYISQSRTWLRHCIGIRGISLEITDLIRSFLPDNEDITDSEYHWRVMLSDKKAGLAYKATSGKRRILQSFVHQMFNAGRGRVPPDNRSPLLIIGDAAGKFSVAAGGPATPVPMNDLLRCYADIFKGMVVFVSEFRTSQHHGLTPDGAICMAEVVTLCKQISTADGRIVRNAVRGLKRCRVCARMVTRDCEMGATNIGLNGAEIIPQLLRNTTEGQQTLRRIRQNIPSQLPFQQTTSQKRLESINTLVVAFPLWRQQFLTIAVDVDPMENFNMTIDFFRRSARMKNASNSTMLNVIVRCFCVIKSNDVASGGGDDVAKQCFEHLLQVLENFLLQFSQHLCLYLERLILGKRPIISTPNNTMQATKTTSNDFIAILGCWYNCRNMLTQSAPPTTPTAAPLNSLYSQLMSGNLSINEGIEIARSRAQSDETTSTYLNILANITSAKVAGKHVRRYFAHKNQLASKCRTATQVGMINTIASKMSKAQSTMVAAVSALIRHFQLPENLLISPMYLLEKSMAAKDTPSLRLVDEKYFSDEVDGIYPGVGSDNFHIIPAWDDVKHLPLHL